MQIADTDCSDATSIAPTSASETITLPNISCFLARLGPRVETRVQISPPNPVVAWLSLSCESHIISVSRRSQRAPFESPPLVAKHLPSQKQSCVNCSTN